jgi:NAD+ kinase
MIDIKRVGVVLRPSTPELKDIFLETKAIFEANGIDVAIDSLSAGMIGVLGQSFESMCQESDILISLGGDGTLISLVRRSFIFNKPILGINVGNLGFLTDINPEESRSFLEDMNNSKYRIDSRVIIEASLKDKQLFAFNDIVINRRTLSKMIHINAYINGECFNIYHGDGLIISTPTGSTAYNLSSNGPVLFPLTEAFLLTPICPHSLTQRALVLPIEFELEFSIGDNEGGVLIVDGQEIYNISIEDRLKVKISQKRAKLIHKIERDYFGVLREKLLWGK